MCQCNSSSKAVYLTKKLFIFFNSKIQCRHQWRFDINQPLFADDTALVADSEEKMCRLVSEFGRGCERRKLRVNVGKSHLLLLISHLEFPFPLFIIAGTDFLHFPMQLLITFCTRM